MPDSMLPALAAAPDAELRRLLTSAASLDAVDAFFTRGAALQTRADASMDEDARLSAARSLAADSCAVFTLFQRVTQSTALLPLGVDCGLLHVTRVAPFCQIYAPKNAAAVGAILDTLVENEPAFSTALPKLRQLYIKQLNNFNEAVRQPKRAQVVQLLRRGYELSLSVAGLTAGSSVTPRLLLAGVDLESELGRQDASVLYGLVQLYEAALPALQRQVRSFDDKAQTQEAPLIAETRRTLLLVLARCLDAEMERQEAGGSSTGEELLAGLHALSNGCLDDEAEHGSFLSDLWYLCEYKDKVAAFFDRCKLDAENFSYLDMVIEGLPRRRVLLTEDLTAETKPTASLSADAKEWMAPAVVEETKPAASQSDDVETVLAPMVTQVKDFFPDLGEGYVELCLLSSNLQVEVVINFLLESNPPPVLIDVTQDLKRSDPEFVRLEAQITGTPAPAPKVEESKKLDPSRVWVGKKSMEKTYDPQIAKKDQQLVEKMKQLVDMYEDEDEYGAMAGGEGSYGGRDDGIAALDEYDDDYNDEFDDFVPFSVRDGGSADDQDAIREQNRRMRLKEEKDAFWEGMRNRNHENPLNSAGDEENEEEEKEAAQSSEGKQSRPNSAGGPSPGSSGQKQKSTRRKDKRQGAEKKPDEPLTPQQIQRQRARKDKNKAKVANHNRKDRAMKKMG
ncbi:Ubiquitin system component Cue [Phytophthora cinnamomi]|uniref:Ubiquitin system component Cue n=1 Tax=Phytophthora cinnamomi TaxID=4785 RepID=UPI00355A8CC9|nr:Ubiquitin system component Cue [Phytophthora cinnamomi]